MPKGVYVTIAIVLIAASVRTSRAFGNELDFVRPEQFGAKGDGRTDDSGAIQGAINSCNNLPNVPTGCVIRFDRKRYAVKSTLRLAFGVTLQGEGANSSILDFHDEESGPGILVPGINQFAIRDLGITNPYGNGIYVAGKETQLNNSSVFELGNLNIEHSRTGSGILLGTAFMGTVRNVWAQYNHVHGFASYGRGSLVTSLTFESSYALHNGVNGFSLSNILYSSLISTGSDFNGSFGYALQEAAGLSLNAVGAENNPDGAFSLVASNATGAKYDVRGIVINGCFVFDNGLNPIGDAPSLVRAQSTDGRLIEVTFVGCVEDGQRPRSGWSVLADGNVTIYKTTGSFAYGVKLSQGALLKNAAYDTNGDAFSRNAFAGPTTTPRPKIFNCGIGASVQDGSTDFAGEVTAGADIRDGSCVIEFASNHHRTGIFCVVTQQNGAALAYALTPETIRISRGATDRAKINWVCFQRSP